MSRSRSEARYPADDALREAAGASTIGIGAGDEGDPAPGMPSDGPGFALEAAPVASGADGPAKARKPRTTKPKPVRYQNGEVIRLNPVEITRNEYKTIGKAVMRAFAAAYRDDPRLMEEEFEPVKWLFDCLYPAVEGEGEAATP